MEPNYEALNNYEYEECTNDEYEEIDPQEETRKFLKSKYKCRY